MPATEILTLESERGEPMNQIDSETDLVVIGSGGSGLAAAVTVAEEGVNAMVFEKKPSLKFL